MYNLKTMETSDSEQTILKGSYRRQHESTDRNEVLQTDGQGKSKKSHLIETL